MLQTAGILIQYQLKGTIRTLMFFLPLIPLKVHFNSIKVRLEHAANTQDSLSHVFQFHKGTIRTQGSGNDAIGEHLFQFHKGTIRTRQNCFWCFFCWISIP